jgi:hypothetical protein
MVPVPLDRDPFPGPVAIVGQVDVRVELQLVQLVRLDVGDEPEIAAFGLGLGGHGPRDQVAVRPAGGEHGDLDALDEIVEVIQLLLETGLVGHAYRRRRGEEPRKAPGAPPALARPALEVK